VEWGTSRAGLHEIKHDGFRVIARKDGPRVKLYSRPGNDLTERFPLIVEAAAPAEVTNVLVPADFRQMSECLPSPEFG
jgi:ATP-dependent DNA ligase